MSADYRVNERGVRTYWRRLLVVEARRAGELPQPHCKLAKRLETTIVISLLAFSFYFGASVYLKNIDSAIFYQRWFDTALNLACTGKFEAFRAMGAALEFLQTERQQLPNCDGVAGSVSRPLNGLDPSNPFLQLLAAFSWRVFGIAWESLFFVAGLLTAGFCIANYALLRVFFPSRLVSAFLAISAVATAPAVNYIQHLRDYSKAAFIVAAIAILAGEVIRPRSLRRHVFAGLSAGVVVGVGLGFRNDINVILPMVALLPLLLLATVPPLRFLKASMCIWGGFVAGYVALSIVRTSLVPLPETTGSFVSHFFVLGFADPFFRHLGMSDAPYSVISFYKDGYAHALGILLSGAVSDVPSELPTAEYQKVMTAVFELALLQTPNDAFLRVFYAANKIGDISIFNMLFWNLFIAIVLCFVALTRGRQVLSIAIPYAILVSASTLQFDERHVFYLAIFGPAVLLIILEAAVSQGRDWFRGEGLQVKRSAVWLVLGAAVGSASAVAIISSWSLSKQATSLKTTLGKYRHLNWTAIDHSLTGKLLSPTGHLSLKDGTMLRFETKTTSKIDRPGPVLVAFSRMRFTVNASAEAGMEMRIVDWNIIQGELTKQAGGGVSIESDRPGYIIQSAPISGRALLNRLSTELGRQVILRISGETRSGTVLVRVLNVTRNRWVTAERIPGGTWILEIPFEIGADTDEFRVVFENGDDLPARLNVRSVAYDRNDSDCHAQVASVAAKYSYLGKSLITSQKATQITPAMSGPWSYFFPVIYSKYLSFEGVELSGVGPNCLIDWSITTDFPAGVLPVEMLATESGIALDHRGDWGEIWRDFLSFGHDIPALLSRDSRWR